VRYLISVNDIPQNIILSDDLATAEQIAALNSGTVRVLANGEIVDISRSPAVPSSVITRHQFFKRLGKNNRKQIRAILATNADVADGWELIHSVDLIDLTDDDVVTFVHDVKDAGIWNNARVTAILTP
jgi:hypothetical protein